MGRTSSAVKNRYNEKSYDMIHIVVKKGEKDRYKAVAEKMGLSLSQFFVQAAEKYTAEFPTETKDA